MLYCLYVTLYCIIGQVQAVSLDTQNCTELRDMFANASSEFIKCSIQFSRPILFCEKCTVQYIHIQESYNDMLKAVVNGTPCINNFVNLDRLEIVKTLYDNSINLWNGAKCYECYDANDQNKTEVSNKTKTFKKFYEIYNNCVKQNDDDTCTNCMASYVDLQDYYLSITNENEKIGGCMDIVDLMNTTWTFWGDKCCEFRRHSEYGFIGSTIGVCIVTILFYIMAQYYAKHKSPTIIQQSRFAEVLNTLST